MPKGEEASRKRRIGWVIAWALSLILAFILGHQMGEGRRVAAMRPSPTAAAPSAGPGTPGAPAAGAATPNPEVAAVLRQLPRRQAEDPLAKGAVDAKVVLTEWSDYRCPYCARWANETLPQLQRYVDDGTLRIEYRDMAVFGEESVTSAVAARAAGEQGRFWEYYTAIFAAGGEGEHPNHSTEELVQFARTAGVPDIGRFETDLTNDQLRQAVLADTQEAQQFGITGTPFFVVNTAVISGARPVEDFVAAIEQAASE